MKNKVLLKIFADILIGAILLGIFYLINYAIPREYKAEDKIESK